MFLKPLFALLLFATILCGAAAEYDDVSPKGSFTIRQRYEGMLGEGKFRLTIHAKHRQFPDAEIPNGLTWPADFSISPDERWILHVQKTGAGYNTGALYHFTQRGQLEPWEPEFSDRALEAAAKLQGMKLDTLYHTGMEAGAWDLQAGTLTVTMRGSNYDTQGRILRARLLYHLPSRTFRVAPAAQK